MQFDTSLEYKKKKRKIVSSKQWSVHGNIKCRHKQKIACNEHAPDAYLSPSVIRMLSRLSERQIKTFFIVHATVGELLTICEYMITVKITIFVARFSKESNSQRNLVYLLFRWKSTTLNCLYCLCMKNNIIKAIHGIDFCRSSLFTVDVLQTAVKRTAKWHVWDTHFRFDHISMLHWNVNRTFSIRLSSIASTIRCICRSLVHVFAFLFSSFITQSKCCTISSLVVDVLQTFVLHETHTYTCVCRMYLQFFVCSENNSKTHEVIANKIVEPKNVYTT